MPANDGGALPVRGAALPHDRGRAGGVLRGIQHRHGNARLDFIALHALRRVGPTFGFVPRTGAMALSWRMDKIGLICLSVEDCAMVMNYIHRQDGMIRHITRESQRCDGILILLYG